MYESEVEYGGTKYAEPQVTTFATTDRSSGIEVHSGDFVTDREERDLSRGLHQRHISLIVCQGCVQTIDMKNRNETGAAG